MPWSPSRRPISTSTRWPQGRSMGAALDRWRETVRPRTGPYRTLFRLGEPGRALDRRARARRRRRRAGEGLPAPWTIEVLVAARDDPSLVLPAALVWTDPGPLRRLRRPSGPIRRRPFSPTSAARRVSTLRSPEPARHSGTGRARTRHRSGARFLREGAPVLVDAGFGVLLPAWWRNRRRRLGLRLRVRGERVSAPRGGVEPGVGVDSIVDYDWRLAIGDSELSDEELCRARERQERSRPIRGEWVEDRARRDRRDTQGDRGQRSWWCASAADDRRRSFEHRPASTRRRAVSR